MRSGDAYRVRTWDPDSGNLRWDVSIGEAKPADGGSRISFTASGDLLVGAGSTTVKLDRKSGSKMWAFVSDANTASLPEVWHVGSEVLISLRASKMSGEATVIVLQRSLADGKVIVEYELADAKVDLSQMPLDKLVQVVEHQNVSFLFIRTPGSGQSPILSHKIGSREIVEQTQAIPMGGPRGLHFEGGPSRPFGRVLVRLTDGGLLTLSIDDKDGKLKPTTQFDSRSKPMIIDTRIAAETDNHVCLTYARPWKTTLTFEAIDLSNNKVVPVTFPHSSRTTGFPVKTFIGRSQSRGAQSYRFLTVFEDGSVHLFDERGPVWKREESLADVADAVFIEFAEEKLLVQDFAERGTV